MPARIDWDEWAFGIAEAVSRRATCPRAAIGVVLLDGNHHVVATGYNGSSSGTTHCLDDGCMLYGGHCVRAVHAERNAVRAAREMLSKYMYGRGADEDQIESISLVPLDIQPYIYGPREICSDCARVMFRAGITKEPKAKWPA